YLAIREVAERSARLLTTLEGLERHEGHLLNWYDTRTCAPLLPRYVSTVDSGNLAGALVALAQGLRELAGAGDELARSLEGLGDSTACAEEAIVALARLPSPGNAAAEGFRAALGTLRQALEDHAPAR